MRLPQLAMKVLATVDEPLEAPQPRLRLPHFFQRRFFCVMAATGATSTGAGAGVRSESAPI